MAFITGDIVNLVQKRIRDTAYDTSEIKQYLNDTQNDIFNEYRLSFMETSIDYVLTIGNSDITSGAGFPVNYSQAIDLVINYSGTPYEVPYKDIREIERLYPMPDNTVLNPIGNSFLAWYIYAQIPRIYPVPSVANMVTLLYYRKPTLLVNDTDIPSIPSEFQELLVVGAAFRVLQVKDQYDQAGILENKYQELLQKLVMKTAQKQVGQPTLMRSSRHQVSRRSF